MALISLEHVSKVYPKGTRPALDDINLDIDRGDFVFLVGASGSGKTTLLSLLLREEEVTDGEIRVAGNDLRRLSSRQVPHYRRSIGFIFQDYKLLNNKTVWENVAFALEVIGTSRSTVKSLVPKVLQTVGLTGKENNYPHELSGGMRQRIMIAMALACNPRLIIADEPTTALDVTIQAQILDLLRGLKDKINSSIMLITHDLGVVAEMADYVVVMYAGRVVEKGTAREIFKDPRHPYTIGLMKSKPVVGKYTEKLYSIPGSVPNPIDMPDYCYFKDRCEMCVDGCEGAYPGMYQISPTHFVSCYRCAAEAVGKEGDTKNEQ